MAVGMGKRNGQQIKADYGCCIFYLENTGGLTFKPQTFPMAKTFYSVRFFALSMSNTLK